MLVISVPHSPFFCRNSGFCVAGVGEGLRLRVRWLSADGRAQLQIFCSPFPWSPSEFPRGSLISKRSWWTAGLSHDGPSNNLWALACFINMPQRVFSNHIWSWKKSIFKFFQWTMFNFLHLEFLSKPIKIFRNLVLTSPFWNFWDPFIGEILLADSLNKTLICWVCLKLTH